MDVVDLTAAAAAALVLAVLAAFGVVRRRRRRPATAANGAVWTAAAPPSWLTSTPAHEEPEPDVSAPGGSATPEPEPVTAEHEPIDRAQPCDWELHLATGGEVAVLRRARHHACCIHTLSLAWLDAPPEGERTDQGLTWSGERTDSDPGGVWSDTRRARTTDRTVQRGPGMAVSTEITREPGPRITTPWMAAADTSLQPDRPAGTERLWTAHTGRLRHRGVRPRPDDSTVVSVVDVVDRLRVEVGVERGCPTGGHRVAARVRSGVEVTGTVEGAHHGACHVRAVAAWTDGDLRAAATTTAEAASGTTVGPLATGTSVPVPSAAPLAMTVQGDPVPGPVTASLVGEDATTTADDRFATTLGGLALLELALGAADRTTAEARLGVVLHHRLAVVVSPDAPEARHPCQCRPEWALHLGDEVRAEPSSSPVGRLVVDDREFAVHRARSVGPPGAAWLVPTGR